MQIVRTPKGADKGLPSYMAEFLQHLEVSKDSSSRTIENYQRFLEPFFKWLRQEDLMSLKPHQLTTDHIYGYRLFLSNYRNPTTSRTLKKSTKMYYLVALRAFLGFFAEQGIKSLPVSAVGLPSLKDKDRYKSIKFLSLEQLRRLLETPNIKTMSGVRDRAILETLFSTGLRVSELTSLNVKHIPAKANPAGPTEITVTGKGDRMRPVYLSPRAIKWLQEYVGRRTDDDPALFVRHKKIRSTKSRRLTVRAVEAALEKYSTEAGLPFRVTPHVLRHTFATDLLNKGVDSRTVQEFLGHANLATTQMYLHVTNVKLREIHSKFHSKELE
jgi:site-specific recombinase XerD